MLVLNRNAFSLKHELTNRTGGREKDLPENSLIHIKWIVIEKVIEFIEEVSRDRHKFRYVNNDCKKSINKKITITMPKPITMITTSSHF